MPKFRITVSKREQDWSQNNEPLQSQQCIAALPLQSQQCIAIDTTPTQSTLDTPGYGRAAEGDLSPLSD
jgi:hypothetical protein